MNKKAMIVLWAGFVIMSIINDSIVTWFSIGSATLEFKGNLLYVTSESWSNMRFPAVLSTMKCKEDKYVESWCELLKRLNTSGWIIIGLEITQLVTIIVCGIIATLLNKDSRKYRKIGVGMIIGFRILQISLWVGVSGSRILGQCDQLVILGELQEPCIEIGLGVCVILSVYCAVLSYFSFIPNNYSKSN